MASELWPHYRRLRMATMAEPALREYLSIELASIPESAAASPEDSLHSLLARQTLQSLDDLSTQALESLDVIVASVSDTVLDDVDQLAVALHQRVPDLDAQVGEDILQAFRSYQTPRAYLEHFRQMWEEYRQAYSRAAEELEATSQAHERAPEIARRLSQALSSLPPPAHYSAPEVTAVDDVDEVRRWMAQAQLRATAYGDAGNPVSLSDGTVRAMALRATATQPSASRELGIGVGNGVGSVACLFPSGPSIAFCLLVLAIALSRHNVDEEEDSGGTSGGGTGGGGTGGGGTSG